MDRSYFAAEVKRREELETFAIRRFDSIFENRKKESLDNVQRYGLEGYIRYLDSAPYPLGWEKEWGNLLMQYMREWVGLGYNRSQREIKTELLKSAADPYQKQINSAISYWDSYGLKLSQVEDRDVINRVISQLQFGINQGLPIGDMQALLGQTLDTFKASRLENIVRTESGKAYNWGIITNIYENSDICQYVEVMAVMDKRTTDICIARDGTIIPLSDTSLVAQYTPPFHYQCRTRLVGVVRPSKVKSLPPDKELIEKAAEIKKSVPILDGFGLSPDDMKIFKANANQTWIIDNLRKPLGTAAPSKSIVKPYTNSMVKKIFPNRKQSIHIDDHEAYNVIGMNTELETILKTRMDDYHQLLKTDKIFQNGVIVETNGTCNKYSAVACVLRSPSNVNISFNGGVEFFQSLIDFNKTLIARSKPRWMPMKCNDISYVIDHEMGHAITNIIAQSQYGAEFIKVSESLYRKMCRDSLTKTINKSKIISQYGSNLNLAVEKLVEEYFAQELSIYANYNYREMVAEGWAEYLNNPNPRPIATKIGKMLTKYLNKIL